MTRPASDALSLTLPARSKTRTRRKRPRKPTGWEAWYLTMTVWCACWAVSGLVAGAPVIGVWQAVGAGVYWRMFQRERRGVRPNVFGVFDWAWMLAGVPLLIVGG